MKARSAICAAAAFALAASASDPMDMARAALRDGMWEVAEKHARAALEGGGDEAAARLAISEAALARGDASAALAAFDGASPEFASSPAARLARAAALERAGRKDEALAALDGVEPSPGDGAAQALAKSRALRMAARLAEEKGDIPRASAFHRSAASAAARAGAAERAAAAVEYAGFAVARLGDRALARKILEEAESLKVSGEAGDAARFLHAGLLPDPAAAAAAMAAVADGDGVSPAAAAKACMWLAKAAAAAGDRKTAVERLRAAAARAVAAEDAVAAGLALGRELANDPSTLAEGVAALNAAVRRHPGAPESPPALLAMGDVLCGRKAWAAAAEEFRLYLEAYPGAAGERRAMAGRARALHETGRYDEALGLFRRAGGLASSPAEKADCSFSEGDVLVSRGNFGEAAEAYGAAAALYGKGARAAEARFRRACALERAGRKEEALSAWKDIDAAGGDFADESALRIGAAESAAGRNDAATAAYSRVLARRPAGVGDRTAARARLGRGKALYRSYKFQEALADFEEAQSDAPSRDEARYCCAMCLLNLKRGALARKTAEEALSQCAPDSPWRPRFLLWLGKYDFNERDYARAGAEFMEFAGMKLDVPDTPDALFWAVRCAIGRKDYPAAVETAGALVAGYPSAPAAHEARLLQAEALRELSRLDEAVLVLRGVTAPPAPQDTATRAAILAGDCLFAMGAAAPGRYREALEAYAKAAEDAGLPPTSRITLAFKAARVMDKAGMHKQAMEKYYSDVIMPFRECREKDVWLGEDAAVAFVRAASALADHHEKRGDARKAVAVMRLVASTLPSAKDAAERRAEAIEAKGGNR